MIDQRREKTDEVNFFESINNESIRPVRWRINELTQRSLFLLIRNEVERLFK